MNLIELTISQHENRTQDPGIAINPDKIISLTVFKYSAGDVVTVITLDTGIKVEVTETYKEIIHTLRKMK